MKAKLHLLALKPGRRRGARRHTPLKILLILPWMASAPAQTALWFSPAMGVEPEPGSALLLEPMPGPSTNSNLGSGPHAGFGLTPLAMSSPEVPAQPTSPETSTAPASDISLHPGPEGIWQNGMGQGFRSTTHTFSVEAGVGLGMAAFGSTQAHDLALTSLSYGHMWGPVLGKDHWYRGNFEWRMEVFGGMQYHPNVNTDGWLIGLTPHLRYNFATGTSWIPFVDAGAGVTATGIAHPDLGGTFEFNEQVGLGAHWFVRDNLALTGEVNYMHMSCAGINKPNHGLNDVIGMIGLTWFF
jgi:lipid A 3-O-deacylase